MKYIIWGSSLAVVTLLVGVGVYTTGDTSTEDMTGTTAGFGAGRSAIVYKSPTCGCCVGYAEELTKQGFDVEVVATEEMSEVKEKYGIPELSHYCHWRLCS